MKLPTSPFTVADWSRVPATTYPGESGEAIWRTLNIGDLRVRMVEYSPGYLADHWCDRGHVLYVVEGELDIELRDGRKFKPPMARGVYFSKLTGEDLDALVAWVRTLPPLE